MTLEFLNYFKSVPKTGVIYVMERAFENGYSEHDKTWSNLGQGAPETTHFESNQIISDIAINESNREYSSIKGGLKLRRQVADYYNVLFRHKKNVFYTEKNVCISGGGRMALSRLVTALGNINLGHFIPDYTAYEELLGMFRSFVPIPILLDPSSNYKISIKELENQIVGKGLSGLVMSNPSNPTGQVVQNVELSNWINLARKLDCLMVFDEFYSHYLYGSKQVKYMSAAKYINDVNVDPVVIINGLSKNWRCPGLRIGWVVGPESIIEKVSSVGSFLDGGASHPIQEKAIDILNLSRIKKDTLMIQRVFEKKRDYMLTTLKNLGIVIDFEPQSTFYIWGDVRDLPSPINDSMSFFEECLKERVIVVPGVFFDVNPGKRRLGKHSRYNTFIRFSFGPDMESIKVGLESIRRVINKFV